MVADHDSQEPVFVERTAAEQGLNLMDDEGMSADTAGLRIAVERGGCEEFSYSLAFDDEPAPEDVVCESHGLRVFVDPRSIEYLAGSVLSYERELQNTGFDIQNPNAVSECDCGSFTVSE